MQDVVGNYQEEVAIEYQRYQNYLDGYDDEEYFDDNRPNDQESKEEHMQIQDSSNRDRQEQQDNSDRLQSSKVLEERWGDSCGNGDTEEVTEKLEENCDSEDNESREQ